MCESLYTAVPISAIFFRRFSAARSGAHITAEAAIEEARNDRRESVLFITVNELRSESTGQVTRWDEWALDLTL